MSTWNSIIKIKEEKSESMLCNVVATVSSEVKFGNSNGS